ncbi:MAG: 2-oxoacid:acceptor oxidoreductase family protein, partial [Clostridia bacterium]|nr:2-oxoacid:acceptor oxidoreductase family protein [Clostridia bacterium]
IDANEEAKKLGNSKVVNVVVLGLAAKLIGFEKEDWVETIKKTVPQKTIDINVNAFNVGYNA